MPSELGDADCLKARFATRQADPLNCASMLLDERVVSNSF